MLPRRVAFLMLTLVALGLALSPRDSWAEDPPVFLLKWGTYCDSRPGPACTGKFNEPFDLAVRASTGDIYVSDTVNQRIQWFTATGTPLGTFGSFCNISNSTGCVDPDGMGGLALGDGEFWDPVGLTFRGDDLHVAEWSNDRVQVFGPTGSFIRKWGSTGTADGQFDTADDVAFDSQGRVFVVDKLNNRIQRFSSTGSFQFKWGSYGSTDGKFKKPVGIAIDSNDNVFVAEQEGHRIQKFTTDGMFVSKWGTLGNGPGQFNEPVHLAVDAAGNVFVPDSKNHRIQKFDNDGNFLSMWGTRCILANGTDCIDPDGASTQFELGDGQFNEPEGVTVDALGDIYVVDTKNHRVQKFRPGGGGGPAAECTCPTTPPDDRAAFKVGTPRPIPGNRVVVPLLVNTSENVTFTQMTIEYDSNCMTYVPMSADYGNDVTGGGGVAAFEGTMTSNAAFDRLLTINGSGTYTGCGQEVFLVTFEFEAGQTSCELGWNPTPAPMSVNALNHLIYSSAGDGFVSPPDITFCPGQVTGAPCPACDPAALPLADTAVFKLGDVQVNGNELRVPLLVDTREAGKFVQLTIEFNSNCLTLDPATAVTVGGGFTIEFAEVDPTARNPNFDRNLTIHVRGTFSGCDQELAVVTFELVAGPPCGVVWDRFEGGPNSDNKMEYIVGAGGTDGIVAPPDIVFCDVTGTPCTNTNVVISGTVEYYEGGTPIRAGVPTGSDPVTVNECGGMPSTTATGTNAAYSLPFGQGPQTVEICASRPDAACGSNEDGVINGEDVILLQNIINPPPGPTDLRLRIAGNLNQDTHVNTDDVLAIKRWIARKVCDMTDGCGQVMYNNCAGTWKFIFVPDPTDPDNFDTDRIPLSGVCTNATLGIEGILVGDVDGSWPDFFPKPASPIGLALGIKAVQNDEIAVALEADLDAGESLRHVIYSLTYDATEFAYGGIQLASKTSDWGALDNPDEMGVAHGIVHIPPDAQGLRESGEVVVFRFRALKANAASRIVFTRLKANDLDVAVPALEISNGGQVNPILAPARYSLRSTPNPFNPSTRILFTIPAGVAEVPVSLRVFDIGGRQVRTLVESTFGPGEHQVLWDGKTDAGQPSGAGIYVVRIQAGTWMAIEKIALVK